MDELEIFKVEMAELMWLFSCDATVEFDKHIWPKIEQLIESEKAKAASQAVAEYKASLNVKYTPEQIGQRGTDDFNFNPLIPESIL